MSVNLVFLIIIYFSCCSITYLRGNDENYRGDGSGEPSARTGSSIIISEVLDDFHVFLYFGFGLTPSQCPITHGFHNSAFKYDNSLNKYEPFSTNEACCTDNLGSLCSHSSNIPQPRAFSSNWVLGNSVLFYSGVGMVNNTIIGTLREKFLIRYIIETGVWEKIPLTGHLTQSPRSEGIFFTHNSKMYFYGGYFRETLINPIDSSYISSQCVVYNTLYEISNVNQNSYTTNIISDTGQKLPPNIIGMIYWNTGDFLYVHSGYGINTACNFIQYEASTYTLNTNTWDWKKIITDTSYASSNKILSFSTAHQCKEILHFFGGIKNGNNRPYNGAYIMDIGADNHVWTSSDFPEVISYLTMSKATSSLLGDERFFFGGHEYIGSDLYSNDINSFFNHTENKYCNRLHKSQKCSVVGNNGISDDVIMYILIGCFILFLFLAACIICFVLFLTFYFQNKERFTQYNESNRRIINKQMERERNNNENDRNVSKELRNNVNGNELDIKLILNNAGLGKYVDKFANKKVDFWDLFIVDNIHNLIDNSHDRSKLLNYLKDNYRDLKVKSKKNSTNNDTTDEMDWKEIKDIEQYQVNDKDVNNMSKSSVEIFEEDVDFESVNSTTTMDLKKNENDAKLEEISDVFEEGVTGKVLAPGEFCPISFDVFDKNLITKWGDIVNAGSYGVIKKGYIEVEKGRFFCVAVKIIPLTGDVKKKEMEIQREVGIMKAVKHNNLLRCFGCFFDRQQGHIVTEYVKNGDLFKFKYLIQDGKERLGCVRQICEGMVYLHKQNVVHRDLKPQNVLVQKLGEKFVYKICDFGASTRVENHHSTFCGTVEYLAPEQYDAAVAELTDDLKMIDIYSFGIIVWEIYAMETPFLDLKRRCRGNVFNMLKYINQNQLRPSVKKMKNVPHGLIKLVKACWHTDPRRRPKSFKSILKKIKKIQKRYLEGEKEKEKEKVKGDGKESDKESGKEKKDGKKLNDDEWV